MFSFLGQSKSLEVDYLLAESKPIAYADSEIDEKASDEKTIIDDDVCVEESTFSFELIEDNDSLPSVEEGKVYQLSFPSLVSINLFDYLEKDYDTIGKWEELTSKGLLQGSIWDAPSADEGRYQFKYTVSSGAEEILITLIYKKSSLPERYITVSCDSIPEKIDLRAKTSCGDYFFVEPKEDTILGSCPNNYILTRTWIAENPCNGKSTKYVQTITVQDTIAPEFVGKLPEDITILYGDSIPLKPELIAIDGCSGAKIEYTEKEIGDACKTIERTWTAIDSCGNRSKPYRQFIYVVDTVAPVIIASLPPLEITDCDTGKVPSIDDISQIVIDNLSPTDSLKITYSDKSKGGSGTTEDPYITERTYSIVDLCGNTTPLTQLIMCRGNTPPVSGTDIAVTKSVDVQLTQVGEEVIFTITVKNLGAIEATNVVVTDELPAGYSYVESAVTKGDYDEVTGAYTIPSLAPDEIATLFVTAKVVSIDDYTNIVRLTSLDQIDTEASNNEASATVGVSSGCVVTVYNEITPNGDGKNDYFRINCIESYPNSEVKVFNRWGLKVFGARNYQNDWGGNLLIGEGINKGKNLTKGTYYYVVDLGDGSEVLTGWLYIN